MAWQIEPLSNQDQSSFSCGQSILDDWFQRNAGQFQRRDLARVYIARSGSEILGFYSLSSHSVHFEDLTHDHAKGLPRMDVPVVLMGRLAVDQRFQGQGVGAFLLVDALMRVKSLAGQVGVRAVEVHAINDTARCFYKKFGFRSLADSPLHMYLPMHEIRQISTD